MHLIRVLTDLPDGPPEIRSLLETRIRELSEYVDDFAGLVFFIVVARVRKHSVSPSAVTVGGHLRV